MNALICKHEAASNCIIISYADDIIIQSKSKVELQKALNIFAKSCKELGLIISITKTKIMQNNIPMHSQDKFHLNGQILENVSTYRYLGVNISSGNQYVLNELVQVCNQRLKLLKAIARPRFGANIRISKMLYIGYIRSIVDYAAPVLRLYSDKSFKRLEVFQNEAMRVILGCTRTTKVLNMRKELQLPSIVDN